MLKGGGERQGLLGDATRDTVLITMQMSEGKKKQTNILVMRMILLQKLKLSLLPMDKSTGPYKQRSKQMQNPPQTKVNLVRSTHHTSGFPKTKKKFG